ncbi:MAG: NfeD family protein [Gammaproteobacteria bacterium]|nr:NfeD family protein [Gammaproteobacteria bacterium]
MEWYGFYNWLILAGILVLAELFTLGIYFLVLSLGALAASLMSFLELSLSWQIWVAVMVTCFGLAMTYFWHTKRKKEGSFNLELGGLVEVTHWQVDGTARVKFRGSWWSAKMATNQTPTLGSHTIVGLERNFLILQKR